MPLFSAFTPFGMLKFSSAPSRGENIYRAMYAAKAEAMDLTVGTYAEAKVYAQAMGIARGRYALERAQNQLNPHKAVELLPVLEKNWSVVPSETDTLLDRQGNVAAKMVLVRGAVREAIEEGLLSILGTDFVALRILLPQEVTSQQLSNTDPALGARVNFGRPDLPFKTVRFLNPVVLVPGLTTIYYENADTTAAPIRLLDGDLLTVQPDNYGLREVVTVTSATDTTFQGSFSYPHDLNCFATTQSWVEWISTQRIYIIVVKSAAATNAETTRRINDFMSQVGRGVSTWEIVQPTTAGASTIGPFTLNVSPLGAVPLGTVDIVPDLPPDFGCVPTRMTANGGTFGVYGRYLALTTDVQLDGVSYPFTVVDDNHIDVTIPNSLDADFYEVTVVATNGTTVYADAIELIMEASSHSVMTGPSAGGTDVVVRGMGFLRVTDITIDGFSLATWAIVSDTLLTFRTDAVGIAGDYPGEIVGAGKSDLFTFEFT